MIYIASPYSHPDSVVREYRYLQVERYTAQCLAAGVTVFSPIVHTHNAAVRYDMPKDHQFWQRINESFMDRCDSMRILALDGWEFSKGVAHEISYMKQTGKGSEIVFLTEQETFEYAKS